MVSFPLLLPAATKLHSYPSYPLLAEASVSVINKASSYGWALKCWQSKEEMLVKGNA